ncbi:hypothetical protein EII17_11725 [Clostridiales bacterium COT073_COT-073]|nr:hypothetical protein EII17_11725 [Clostridiales bacterium COT073_COT-073]
MIKSYSPNWKNGQNKSYGEAPGNEYVHFVAAFISPFRHLLRKMAFGAHACALQIKVTSLVFHRQTLPLRVSRAFGASCLTVKRRKMNMPAYAVAFIYACALQILIENFIIFC